MNVTSIQKVYRDQKVTVHVPATLDDLLELVPAENIKECYLNYVMPRSVGSQFDGENPKNPEEVDLTKPGAMPAYKSGTRSSKYPFKAVFMNQARVALVNAGKIEKLKLEEYDQDGDDFAKIVTVAEHLDEADRQAKKGLADLV